MPEIEALLLAMAYYLFGSNQSQKLRRYTSLCCQTIDTIYHHARLIIPLLHLRAAGVSFC